MRLQEIMSKPVQTIAPDANAVEAGARMRLRGIHHLVVVSGSEVLGVLSQRDIVRAKVTETVAAVMAPNPVTATPETTVRKAANLMRGRGIGCLPVSDGKRVVGMVTAADLLILIGRGAERPTPKGVRWTLRGRGQRRKAEVRTISH
jgi:acetoin utilization protein AcuB